MSVKGIIAAAAATLAVVGGTAMAATLPADAATPQCGHSCVDLYGGISATLGHPSFVIDAYQQGQAVGTPIIQSGATNTDLNQFILDVRLETPWVIRASTAAQLITDAKRIQAVLGGCGPRLPFF
jgi:hypothetical protein